MKQHGFGIIGCGMIAEFHTRAINEIPNARVVAAWSRNPANGAKIAGLAEGGCEVFGDLDALLAAAGARRRLRLHAQRRTHGARGAGRCSRQARRRRETARDHACRDATRSSTPAIERACGSARFFRRGSRRPTCA